MPNHGLTFTPVYPTRSGRVGSASPWDWGRYDHGTFPSPNISSPTFKRSKDSSVYPFLFILLATLLHIFCTHAKLNPFVFKQFRTLCAIHEGGRLGNKHSLFTRSSGVVYSLGCCGPW